MFSRALTTRIVANITMGDGSSKLPLEVTDQILGHIFPELARPTRSTQAPKQTNIAPYYTPPAGFPFLLVPTEIRQQIFSYLLPARTAVHHPECADQPSACSDIGSKRATEDGPIVSLMLLHSKICREIALVLYEEREFIIHVHEGLRTGGVEFINAGRQPLNFQHSVYDQRFPLFTRDSRFGFDRLKKIRIQIHPAPDSDNLRHTAVNTYFVNLALCRLLERPAKCGKRDRRITSIKIEFIKPQSAEALVGRRAIQRVEGYWWDMETQQPRSTSIHNVSNFELVLRPFANLTRCHHALIIHPPKLASHSPTKEFAAALRASMTSSSGTLFVDDELAKNIEIATEAMENHLRYTLQGKQIEDMERMAQEEVLETGVLDMEDFEDEIDPVGAAAINGGNSDPAPPAVQALQTYEHDRVTDTGTRTEDNEEELEAAYRESARTAQQQEQLEIQRALAASLTQAAVEAQFSPAHSSAPNGTGLSAMDFQFDGSDDEVDDFPTSPPRSPRRSNSSETLVGDDMDDIQLNAPSSAVKAEAAHERSSSPPVARLGRLSASDRDSTPSPSKRQRREPSSDITTQAGNAATPRLSSLLPPAQSFSSIGRNAAVRDSVDAGKDAEEEEDGGVDLIDLTDY